MLIIHCGKCAAPHLGLGTSIESMHRSAEGLVGYVRCPAGHLVIHHFDEAYPKPDPPASVIALRARLAAEEQAASNHAVPNHAVPGWATGTC